MTHSDAINEISAAMAKAQAAMTGAKRESENPFFRSKYPSLASVREACLGAMNENGIAVTQWPRLVSAGEHEWIVEVETLLSHSSGQWMRDSLAVPVTKADAQGVGSAISYARRYALGAVAGVAPEDDDGEAAVGRPDESKQPAAAGAMETVSVKVLGIVKRPTKNGDKFKFILSASDQKTYATFKEDIATEAKRAQEAGLSVDITYKKTQYGLDVVALHESALEAIL